MTPKKTVLITGASSGIGLDTALYFYEQGWNVVATMRHPEQRRTPLHEKGLPDIIHLDVMDEPSIQNAIQYTLDKYQNIDVLVNNAGYAVYGPFEASSLEQQTRQFDTNVFGLMQVVRCILPVFRRQHSGVIINVASMGGRVGFPFYTLYNSTKWAVEGFSEALQYELRPLNIKVRLIEPGVIKTDFYDRSMSVTDNSRWQEAYGGILRRSLMAPGSDNLKASSPLLVAKVIHRAATDSSWRLRYHAGSDAWQVSLLRRLLPEGLFLWLMGKIVLG